MGFLVEYILPLVIFLIILSLGLTLQLRDFTRFIRAPRSIVVGLICQFLAAPCLVFALTLAFGLEGYVAMGFIILAACPGGGVSNLIVKFAGGDIPLSVCLTSASNLFSCITLPIVLTGAGAIFLGEAPERLNASHMAMQGFFLCTLPVMLGMALCRFLPKFTRRIAPALSRLATVLLAAVIVGAVAGSWALFVENFMSLAGILCVLLIAMPATGYGVARLLRGSKSVARTVSIETGVQNGAFGIAIGAYIQPDAGFSEASLAPALYGVSMYFSVLLLALLFRKFPTVGESLS